jgi:hypothetical protein
MRKSTKVVIGFGVTGFFLPLLLLTVYIIAGHFNDYLDTTPLFYLCPSSIVSMGLDHASMSTAVFVWLMISATNAVLYAIVPFAIVLIYRVIRPDPQADGPWLR